MCFYNEMREVTMDASEVLYMRRTGPYGRENHALMECFKVWLKRQGLRVEDEVILAVPLDDPYAIEPWKCRYDVCVTGHAGLESGPDGVGVRRLDGGRYVIFLIGHTADAVQRAWSECFSALERHGYLRDPSRPAMERYAGRLVQAHFCELCVPIL